METQGTAAVPGRQIDPAYLDRFNLLDKSGALDDLSELRKENRELDVLINDAAALLSLKNVEEMMSFVISRLLDKFIPMHLVFVIEPPQGDTLKQYCYRNLKQDHAAFPARYYQPIKEFFLSAPYPLDFVAMEKKLGAGVFGDDIRELEPEVLFPLRGIGGLHGIVLFGKKIVGAEYSDMEIMYVDRLTRFLSIAIQNNLHHESSITDSKTGLYNHYYFMKRLGEEIARISRHHSHAGMIMLDVDHFKRFNDTWGHLAGDEVLNVMAMTIKQSIRLEDVAARFGGEEFCILVIECDETKLREIAERIRTAVEKMRVPFKSENLAVTISLGCYFLDPSRAGSPEDMIEKADRALYISKSLGRNCSTLYKTGLLGRATAVRRVVAPHHD